MTWTCLRLTTSWKRHVAAAIVALVGLPGALDAGEPVSYERHVKPILSRKCVACHGALKAKSGLRLDTAARLRAGGDRGPAIESGKSSDSLLIEAVTGSDDLRMPPAGDGEPLSGEQISQLTAWIDAGAIAPDETDPPDPRKHWAFLPPVRPEVPRVNNAGWVYNPVDAFVAAGHDAHGLHPRPDADKSTLLRRVYLDLLGLVPTPDERRAFLADRAPDAYEKVVDRLLDSPEYGERWARHWMDVWRYSDWDGYGPEVRESKPHIWRWRDWIVESLNADKGYDRMIQEMLAGDELAPEDPKILRATGYLVRNWQLYVRDIWLESTVEHTAKAFLGITLNCAKCHDHKYDPIEQADYYRFRAFFEPHQVRTDRIPGQPNVAVDGIVRVFDQNADAKTFLYKRGMASRPVTDKPVPPALPRVLVKEPIAIQPVSLPATASYPGLARFIQDEALGQARAGLVQAEELLAQAHLDAKARPQEDASAARSVALADAAVATARAEFDSIQARIAADAARYAVPPWPEAPALGRKASAAERRSTFAKADEAHLRADVALDEAIETLKPGQSAAVPAVLAAKKARDEARKALATARAAQAQESDTYSPLTPVYPRSSTGRRLALARWMTRRDNPLTARVVMNHIWLRHFGSPIVETVYDFGLNGRPPTHPALLDWLAVELVDRGWSMKAMHRLIVTSHAYRMQSSGGGASDPNHAADPANRYLWRMNPRRLEAELVRDNLLRVSGQLDPTLGGPELDPMLDQTSRRRGLYFRHSKEKQATFLRVFDSANPMACYRRAESVVPQQALALANSPLSFAQSRVLAAALSRRVGAEVGPDSDRAFVVAAFEQVLGRPPGAEELEECLRFIAAKAAQFADRANLTRFSAGPTSTVKPAADPRLRARENVVHVLMNHNDFVTIR
jgi:hypothetical protein